MYPCDAYDADEAYIREGREWYCQYHDEKCEWDDIREEEETYTQGDYEFSEIRRYDKNDACIYHRVLCYETEDVQRDLWITKQVKSIRVTEKKMDPETGYWAIAFYDYVQNRCGYTNSEGYHFLGALKEKPTVIESEAAKPKGEPSDRTSSKDETDDISAEDVLTDIFGED